MQRGLSKGVTGRVRIAQFNDPATLEAALAPGDAALVLTEPAMTNGIHLLLPEPGWHQALRDVTRRHGTLLAIDETHTHVVGSGGATAMWHLDPDIVTIGKAVAGGLPMGAYGVTAELGEHLDAARSESGSPTAASGKLSLAQAPRSPSPPRAPTSPARHRLQGAPGRAALTASWQPRKNALVSPTASAHMPGSPAVRGRAIPRQTNGGTGSAAAYSDSPERGTAAASGRHHSPASPRS